MPLPSIDDDPSNRDVCPMASAGAVFFPPTFEAWLATAALPGEGAAFEAAPSPRRGRWDERPPFHPRRWDEYKMM